MKEQIKYEFHPMKKLYFFLSLLLISGTTAAQQLSWRFANPYIIKVGTFDNLRFDVQVKCDVPGTYFWSGQVVLTLNNSVFTNNSTTWVINKVGDFNGTNTQGNPKYGVVKGFGGSVPNLNMGISLIGDINASPNGPNPDDFTEISTDWTTMLTITARMSDTSGDAMAGIDFVETAMNGQEFEISAADTYTGYTNPNLFDTRDLRYDLTGRFYSEVRGWSQVGNSTAAQWVNWNNNVGTTVWDGAASVNQTDNTVALAKNVLVKNGASLVIPPLKELTVSGNLINDGTVVINSSGLNANGSLIVGSSGGSGKVTYNRWMRNDDWHLFSSPVGGSITAFKSANVTGNVYEYKEPDNTWPFPSESDFLPGKGYNMEQHAAAAGTFAFTGTLSVSATRTGTAPYSVPFTSLADQDRADWGGGGWNLLGNPFTSAMNARTFITTNSASLDASYQAVYLYAGEEGTNGAYYYVATEIPGYSGGGTFNDGAATPVNYNHLQAGQGFFVLARNNGVTFSFTPDMREHHTTVPLKSAGAPWPGLQLKARSGDTENSTLIVFNENMTTGLDPGFDIGQFSAGSALEIYTALVKDNGVNFARQALPLADVSKNVVPVGVDCPGGGKVTFSAGVVPIGNGAFFLEDRITGKFTDLSKDTYSVNFPEKTAGTGRFFIHASPSTGIRPQLADPNELIVRLWTADDKLNIQGSVSEQATAEIFDILGRKILEKRLSGSTLNVLTIPSTVRGVYMVKVTDGAITCIRKVVF